MKTFLDFGTNYFQGLDQFKKKLNIDRSWKVKCFEADPFIFCKTFGTKDYAKKFYSFSHQNIAVFDSDCNLKFNCIKSVRLKNEPGFADGIYAGDFGGSSIYDRRKETGTNKVNETVEVSVRAVAANRLLEEIATDDPSAEIYVKCDIEGSEYTVLPHLLTSEHLGKVKEIYVEWHSRFFGDQVDKMLKLEHGIIQGLASSGVMVHNWH